MTFIALDAGPLKLALNPDDGAVHYLFAGDREILRGIGAPIRDHAWATVLPEISELTTQRQKDSFQVTFSARCRNRAVDFHWRGTLTGAPDGTVVFEFDGEALVDFQRNRIGFCVLHSAGMQGAPCQVEHTDGRRENGHFPRLIQTGAPLSDLRAITHQIAPGFAAEVRMEGDAFEMEDQRNWTDASFKTYCTPLALPRPVVIKRGTRIQQRVTVRLHGKAPKAPSDFRPPWIAPTATRINIGALLPHPLPNLGTIWNAPEPSATVIAALRPLNFAHLRLDLRLDDPAYPGKLAEAAHAAAELGAALELAVFVNDHATGQVARLLAMLSTLQPVPRIARWLVFHETADATPTASIAAVRTALTKSPFAAPVGGGATDNYAELNHGRAVATVADFTVHACNPQVHATDEASMVETLAIQGLTAANARHYSGDRPVVVSPVTFTRRWRLGETGAPSGLPAGLMPFQSDPRQSGDFAAAWSVGSLAALAREGVTSLTYFEAAGANGLLTNQGAPLPLTALFAAVAPYAGGAVAATESNQPHSVAALALVRDNRRLLVIANHHGAPQQVRIIGLWGERSLELPAHGLRSVLFS